MKREGTAAGDEARRAQIERNQEAIAMVRRWSAEDAENPEPGPVPEVPPLVLREVDLE